MTRRPAANRQHPAHEGCAEFACTVSHSRGALSRWVAKRSDGTCPTLAGTRRDSWTKGQRAGLGQDDRLAILALSPSSGFDAAASPRLPAVQRSAEAASIRQPRQKPLEAHVAERAFLGSPVSIAEAACLPVARAGTWRNIEPMDHRGWGCCPRSPSHAVCLARKLGQSEIYDFFASAKLQCASHRTTASCSLTTREGWPGAQSYAAHARGCLTLARRRRRAHHGPSRLAPPRRALHARAQTLERPAEPSKFCVRPASLRAQDIDTRDRSLVIQLGACR